jgi:hypothetical protein
MIFTESGANRETALAKASPSNYIYIDFIVVWKGTKSSEAVAQQLRVANILAVDRVIDHPPVSGRISRLPGGENDFGKVINPMLGRVKIKHGPGRARRVNIMIANK